MLIITVFHVVMARGIFCSKWFIELFDLRAISASIPNPRVSFEEQDVAGKPCSYILLSLHNGSKARICLAKGPICNIRAEDCPYKHPVIRRNQGSSSVEFYDAEWFQVIFGIERPYGPSLRPRFRNSDPEDWVEVEIMFVSDRQASSLIKRLRLFIRCVVERS